MSENGTVKELKSKNKDSKESEMTATAIGRHKNEDGLWVVDVIQYNPESKEGKVKESHVGTASRDHMMEMFKLKVVEHRLLHGE